MRAATRRHATDQRLRAAALQGLAETLHMIPDGDGLQSKLLLAASVKFAQVEPYSKAVNPAQACTASTSADFRVGLGAPAPKWKCYERQIRLPSRRWSWIWAKPVSLAPAGRTTANEQVAAAARAMRGILIM